MRLLTIVSGGLCVLSSVWCFANAGKAFVTMAFVIGLIMILQGVVGIAGYFAVKKKMGNSIYISSEATLSLLLGIMVITNRLVTDNMVTIFFGMWVLFCGVLRTATVLEFDKEETPMWKYNLLLGVVSVVIGILAFFNIGISDLSVVMVVALCMLVQGVNIIAGGIEMPKKKLKLSKSDIKNLHLKLAKNNRKQTVSESNSEK